jgi:hypothetical protein
VDVPEGDGSCNGAHGKGPWLLLLLLLAHVWMLQHVLHLPDVDRN